MDDIAERAGVSVSSIFRNFDGLDDLQRHALERFGDRFHHLLTAGPGERASMPDRVERFVRTRIDLYEQAGPLMTMGRQRALDHQPMAAAVSRNRQLLADQTRAWFQPEIVGRTPAGSADLVALVDTLTSPESFEVMGAAHARSRRQISRAWTLGLASLLAGPSEVPT